MDPCGFTRFEVGLPLSSLCLFSLQVTYEVCVPERVEIPVAVEQIVEKTVRVPSLSNCATSLCLVCLPDAIMF